VVSNAALLLRDHTRRGRGGAAAAAAARVTAARRAERIREKVYTQAYTTGRQSEEDAGGYTPGYTTGKQSGTATGRECFEGVGTATLNREQDTPPPAPLPNEEEVDGRDANARDIKAWGPKN